MSEMKRPEAIQYIHIKEYSTTLYYLKSETDAYIAALERRARIAERALHRVCEQEKRNSEVELGIYEVEIDAELAKEQP